MRGSPRLAVLIKWSVPSPPVVGAIGFLFAAPLLYLVVRVLGAEPGWSVLTSDTVLGPLNTDKKAVRSLLRSRGQAAETAGKKAKLGNGSVVIAAITSCTNTSNPSVMLAAGLVAQKAVAKGLHSKPWVKTSLAPGSKVVTEYLNKAGLMKDLDARRQKLGGELVCTVW